MVTAGAFSSLHKECRVSKWLQVASFSVNAAVISILDVDESLVTGPWTVCPLMKYSPQPRGKINGMLSRNRLELSENPSVPTYNVWGGGPHPLCRSLQ